MKKRLLIELIILVIAVYLLGLVYVNKYTQQRYRQMAIMGAFDVCVSSNPPIFDNPLVIEYGCYGIYDTHFDVTIAFLNPSPASCKLEICQKSKGDCKTSGICSLGQCDLENWVIGVYGNVNEGWIDLGENDFGHYFINVSKSGPIGTYSFSAIMCCDRSQPRDFDCEDTDDRFYSKPFTVEIVDPNKPPKNLPPVTLYYTISYLLVIIVIFAIVVHKKKRKSHKE